MNKIHIKAIIIACSTVTALFVITFAIMIGISIKQRKEIKDNGVRCEAVCIDRERIVGNYNRRKHNREITYTYTFEVTSPKEVKGEKFDKKGLRWNSYQVGDAVTAYYYNDMWQIF